MDFNSLVSKLHPLERKVLPSLRSNTKLQKIVQASGLQEIEVLRALQWLENKQVLKINIETKKVIILDRNGQKYQKDGLPEKKLLKSLTTEFQTLEEVSKKSKLDSEELNACIGILKRKVALDTIKEGGLLLKLGPQGNKILKEGTLEEQLLAKKFPLDLNKLGDIDKFALEELKKRKEFIKIEEQKTTTITLTDLGKKLSETKISTDVVNRLTPEMLKTGSWKNKDFRSYDIEINVPKIDGGRKHFVNEAIDYIKNIWLEMGFKEMSGNFVQSAFWDLDCLFVPQDHPAREMQDTFYLNGKAKLSVKLLERVQEVHENGGKTGSKGWQSKFSVEESEKILLRTHTTVLSAQTISNLKPEDLPAKFFSVNKVFRNEALDWKHLFEFYQVEGIVIDPNANLMHLKGYLKEFYKKMGYTNVRMRPAHFPYTEPSVEVDVYHPVKKQWVELGGAGIFRPEVVIPLLGFDCPILAWGQGMERIIMDYWKLNDVRDLYKNDLKQMREIKNWLK